MKKVLYFLYHSLIDLLAKMTKVTTRHNAVLIIRLDAIGDFILWLDAAKEFRKIYPPDIYKIVLIGNQEWASLAEKTLYFSEVWALNKRSFSRDPIYRYKFLKRVRQAGFETVINTVFSREFYWGDAIVRTCGALNRIGLKGDNANIESQWQRKIADNSYTNLVSIENQTNMELIRNASFMRQLGLTEFRSSIPILNFSTKKPDAFRIRDYFIIFVGASWHGKRWPVNNFFELSKRIHQATGWMGIMCGGKNDFNGYRNVDNSDVPMMNWIGKTSLEELAAIVSEAHLMISNDTSAVHISAAVATPVICVLGGGHYGRFMPYEIECKPRSVLPLPAIHKMDCFGCNWHCIYDVKNGEAAPCILNISVDNVWDIILKNNFI